MTKTGVILSLLMVGLVAVSSSSGKQRSGDVASGQPKAFLAGYEYVFDYNGQIAIGQIALNQQSVELTQPKYAEDSEQKAATRIQCQSKFTFNSEHIATLRLDKCRIGQLNEPIMDAQRVQPMGMFQPKKIDDAKLRELQLPCDFRYMDGMVKAIQFHANDKPWSKNIKRAVLNLIQMNLKQQNAIVSEEDNNEEVMNESEKFFTSKAFSVPETTLEGDCLTTYTINSNSNIRYHYNQKNIDNEDDEDEQKNNNLFNITKSIGFKQCKRIADITFGVQSQPEAHPQCIQCMQEQWLDAKRQQQQRDPTDFYYRNPCEQQCDPKLVDEQQLDRSTVMRFVVAGRPESVKECAIQRAELLSQYVYKNPSFSSIKSSSIGKSSIGGGALRAIVAAELQFRDAKLAIATTKVQLKDECVSSDEEDCSLLYDNTVETMNKRFQMFGDEEFEPAGNPFAHVHGKVDRVVNIYRRIVQSAADKANGLESEVVALMPRLFKILRMCTVVELEQIDEMLRQQIGEEQSQLEKMKQLFADTLAIAGTRNAIAVLMKKIRSPKEFSPIKSAKIISSLIALSSPSTSIVDLVIDVCKSDVAKKSAVLRQSCLLTSGALVGELCRFNAQKSTNGNVQRMVYGQQTGFNADNEICPLNKKKTYKQFFVEQLESAETIYEQILALKAIGNAALDITVAQPLEVIIRGQQKRNDAASPLIRMQAIDALRRVAAQMPRKVQRLLLPIFQNVYERPEVRIIAFSTIMSATRPERPVIDQLVYTLAKEQNRDVQSYVYTMIKALAKSPIFAEQEIAKHLKAALKLANVDDRQMALAGVKSVRARIPLFFGDDNNANQGLLVKLMSVLNGPKSSSQKQMEVGHLAAGIHSIIDGQMYSGNGVGIAATFANADHWARNLLNAMLIQTTGRDSSKKTRSQRNGADSAKLADQELRDIASTLGVQKRKDESTFSSSEEEDRTKKRNGFAMLSLRIGNIDRAVIPFFADMLPASLKSLLNGHQSGKLSIAEVRQLLENSGLFESVKDNSGSYNKQYQILSALMLNGDQRCIVPTTLGLPLKITHSSPVVFGVDGQLKPAVGAQSLKAHLNVHATGCVLQSRTMNVALPTLVTCGVKSERAVEFHAPLSADMELNAKEGVKITLKTPTLGQTPLKTRLFGIHTLAATFTRDFDAKTHMFREPKVKSIHSAHYVDSESDGSNAVVRHMDINHLFGEHSIGIPLRVNGHFYAPGGAVQRNAVDYLITLCQISSTSENHVHITYEPTDDTPREIVLRAEAAIFQKLSASSVLDMVKQLRDFYAQKSHRFQSASMMMGEKGSEEDIYTDGYHKQNNEKFNEHLDQFSSTDSMKKIYYKHSIKLSAQTVGGRKQARAELELHAACDAKHKLCKMTTAAKRTPMLADESEWWTLRSDAAAVMPDYVSTFEHLEDDVIGSRKNQKFMLHAKTEWGCAVQNKQSMEIRVEGQNKKDKQLKKLIANISAQQSNGNYEQQQSAKKSSQQLKRETAFLNHFALVADYKLQPHMKAIASRAMEALKTYHFWSAIVQAPSKKQQSGRLYANLEIAVLTQRHASLIISTPTEQVQIPSIVLPIRVSPMPLVQAADASTHSFTQALSRWSSMSSGNAECRAYANRVATFDGVEYTQPITTDCYTVLAKDCSEQAAVEQQPRFVVLMKSVSKDGKQKKIKVVTSSNIVECQSVYNGDDATTSSNFMIASSDYSSSKKIQCMVNGEIVTAENSAEFFNGQQPLVEYNNGEMTSAVIHLAEAGVRVRFGCLCAACDCQKAVVTYLDERYKRASCGLCGHYDDSTDGEWRSADDTLTDDLAAFHRSYAVRNAEECSAGKLDAFYRENKQKFRVLKQSKKMEDDDFLMKNGAKKTFQNVEDDDEGVLKDWQAGSYVDEDDTQEVVSSEEVEDFYGSDNKNGGDYNMYSTIATGESSEEDDDQGFFDFAGKKQQKQLANKKKVIEPESQTRVIEYNHLICFSVQPVKQCPSGTIAAYKPINQITKYDIEMAAQDFNEAELGQQSTDDQPKTNVKFACLSRSLSTARRMQHQAKRGVIVDVSGYPPNSVELVVEPKSCIKINNKNY